MPRVLGCAHLGVLAFNTSVEESCLQQQVVLVELFLSQHVAHVAQIFVHCSVHHVLAVFVVGLCGNHHLSAEGVVNVLYSLHLVGCQSQCLAQLADVYAHVVSVGGCCFITL